MRTFRTSRPGTLLSFTIDTANVPDPGGTPDLFTVVVLDSHGIQLPTTGAADEFLDVSLGGGANPRCPHLAPPRERLSRWLLPSCNRKAQHRFQRAIILLGAADCGRCVDGGACYAPAQAAVAELSSALLLVSVRDVFVTRKLSHYCRSA